MDDQTQPESMPTEDLAAADARAFLADNMAPEDDSAEHANESSQVKMSEQDKLVTEAVEQARKLRGANKPKGLGVPFTVAAAIVVLLATLILIRSSTKPSSAGDSNIFGAPALSVPTPDSAGTSGLDNQTKQDIQTCSNVTNAALGKC